MESLHNNFVAGLEPFGHFPHRADAFAHFHRTNADLVVLIDNCDLKAALQLVYRFLRNHHRALFHVGDEPHFAELSRPQNVSRIRKRHIVADRSSLRIQATIERIKFSFVRIQLAVAEDQFEVEGFYVRIALSCIRMARNEIGERSFARGDDSFDRVKL